MRRWLNFSIIFTSVFFLVVFLYPLHAYADFNDFEITNFHADYYLTNSSPHGNMDVTEKIELDFQSYNHGILRVIPATYKNHPLKLKVENISSSSGAPSQFTTYKNNGNTVLKIGDPNQTVTGNQSYTINYHVQNVITFYPTHDELFWDINGDQWQQNFDVVTANFHIPVNLASQLQNRMACFTGKFGSNDKNCVMTKSKEVGGVLITATATSLSAGQTLSMVLAFNKGTFQPYTLGDTLSEHKTDIILGTTSLIILGLAFRRWWKKGKDPKGAGVIVPQYGPPKGVSVLDAGILQDYKLDNKDISAVIIDLAIRGYITITETDKKTFLSKTTTTTLTLNKTDTSKLKDYEITLLQTLFEDPLEAGASITLGKYQSGMSTAIRKIGKDSLTRLTKDGMFDTDPGKSSGGWMVLYIFLTAILIFLGFKLGAPIAGVLACVCVVIIVILSAHMPRRSQQGALFNDDLKGLKLYLKTAEADRIKMLQSPNAKYAQNAAEPKRTVQLFEKLLPFAIIFGVEKAWAKQFNDLYTSPPDWYQGNWTAFNAVMLTNHINSTNAAFGSTFSPPSSSSSSGFSGGGSGGGGGGGGGGGW